MEDPKSGAVRLSEEGESMYIVITAAADINIAYSGNDRVAAMTTIIREVHQYLLDAIGEVPKSLPEPDEWEAAKDGWAYLDEIHSLSINLDTAGAKIVYGDDQMLIQLKKVKLNRTQLREAADAYEALVREEIVRERCSQHGWSKDRIPQDVYQEAFAAYNNALEAGASEDTALEKLEQTLGDIDSDYDD